MYDCMRATTVLSCLFFVILVILGNFIMLNLFLAILLGKFEEVQDNLLKKEKLTHYESIYKLSSSEKLNEEES